MTAAASPPFWPRYLSRDEAARYVGVSADTFAAEIASGLWPAGRPRGAKGGRLTWDRLLLDREADRYAGLGEVSQAEESEAASDPALEALERRIDGQTDKQRAQRRQQAAA